jgi:heptosyltransferase-2
MRWPGSQKSPNVKKEHILVVGPSWVGDMVMAQSLFKRLKQRDSEVVIDVLAPEWSLPVIERMPEVRSGVALDVAHGEFGFYKRRRRAKQLRTNHYDQAIVLPRSFKAALVPWFAGIPKRTGFRGESRYGLINDMRVLDKKRLDQTVKRFVALGLDKDEYPDVLPQPELTILPENQHEAKLNLQLPDDRPAVALMPGAEFGPAKCWPLESYSALARLLGDAGYEVWVLGSAKDAAAGRAIAGASTARNLCGKTSLADVIDLLAWCSYAVSNDSGLMHIAAAVGTCVHAIYGSSTPDYTPPLTENKVIHQLQLDCRPCFERECPLGHLNCLNGIAPGAIFASMQR